MHKSNQKVQFGSRYDILLVICLVLVGLNRESKTSAGCHPQMQRIGGLQRQLLDDIVIRYSGTPVSVRRNDSCILPSGELTCGLVHAVSSTDSKSMRKNSFFIGIVCNIFAAKVQFFFIYARKKRKKRLKTPFSLKG